MILSKRERYIAILAGAVLAVLVLDRYLITPVLDRRAQMEADLQSAVSKMERAASLLTSRNQMSRRWKAMLDGGLKADPSEAENQVLRVMHEWSRQTGLALASVKPDRSSRDGDLREISFVAVGTGTMEAVGRFLLACQNSAMPLRIQGFQLGSRKDGTDDLSLTLTVSTIYLAGETRSGSPAGAKPLAGGGAR